MRAGRGTAGLRERRRLSAGIHLVCSHDRAWSTSSVPVLRRAGRRSRYAHKIALDVVTAVMEPVETVVADGIEVLRSDQAGPDRHAPRSDGGRPDPGGQREIGNVPGSPSRDRGGGFAGETLTPCRGGEAVEEVEDRIPRSSMGLIPQPS